MECAAVSEAPRRFGLNASVDPEDQGAPDDRLATEGKAPSPLPFAGALQNLTEVRTRRPLTRTTAAHGRAASGLA